MRYSYQRLYTTEASSLKGRQKGLTLLETIMSLLITSIFLVAMLSAWYFSSKSWNQENVKGLLRFKVEKVMERLKNDVQMTDGNSILFYPSAAATYTAISLPRMTMDSNGFYSTTSGSVNWSNAKTIIYHVYTNGSSQELRRTTFDTFNTTASARQTQLNNVVTSGTGSGIGGTTATLFAAPSVTLSINSTTPTFDGYSATAKLSSNTSFGSIRLSSGNHTVQFQVTGKNASSSSYKMGFDSLALNPSGGPQEAEALGLYTNSGKSSTVENMSGYGTWGGNHHLEYQSTAVGDYATFQVYYDQWLESNFENMTHSNTEVGGTNPSLTLQSRESASLIPAWQAIGQTVADQQESAVMTGKSVRTIVSGASLSISTGTGQMARIKFIAPLDGDLTIDSAYFGVKGSSSDFDESVTPIHQLNFSNAAVVEGDVDGNGAIGNTGPTSITIPAGYHVWSNWFEYATAAGSNYLISYSVSSNPNQANTASWVSTDPSAVNSYICDGDHASEAGAWQATPPYNAVTTPGIYGTASVAVWGSSGTATSQVYDTKLTTPVYGQLSWDPSLPAGSTVSFKVRSADAVTMLGASSWTSLSAYTTSPASLISVPSKRFLQFQTTFQAGSPYTSFPSVDNIKITWPGQTALVEITGQYTERPNYGIFKVLVDGQPITKALGVGLTAAQTYQGKIYSFSLNSEIRPKNTGK